LEDEGDVCGGSSSDGSMHSELISLDVAEVEGPELKLRYGVEGVYEIVHDKPKK
jgi:hypothetical protein